MNRLAAETVGVVVPMYNAEATIGETLASVCAQTHAALDIVVVDDGSTDRSCSLVEEAARRDARIRLVRQKNLGVAAARNRGAAATDARYLAFVDADDLWAPAKIAAQMERLAHGGAPALIYCWFAQIDGRSRIYPPADHALVEGNALQEICRRNFVGNGSSLLVPREIFDHVGGFDPSLRAQGAQGCEDLLFLAMAARRYEFRAVPRFLLGYRLTHANMSSDTARMLRSFEIVADRVLSVAPETAESWDEHYRHFLVWLCRRAAMAGRPGEALSLLATLGRRESREALAFLPELAGVYARSRLVPEWLKSAAVRAGLSPLRQEYRRMAW